MSKKLEMFGLAHCSTCQKAQAALEAAGWQVAFRDVQKDPLSEVERQRLADEWGEKIINRASLTWRGMSDAERDLPPVQMMGEKPSVMKRPAIAADDLRLLGWTANVKRALGAE
ncbi:MAG: hypothetical protein Q4G14_03100 [Paracoccus sp. (in: a-proteobacteria)]|uniref:arsenate reductase family protein n=1 Tax=Paracoccus sp. TaxID=267 RepID=UPI0026E0C50F|nr:ArsC/Spx/MgsR family protein [Paracoccus sp. (in: a-proteobacteria)]MDO5612213.1 hypothetical protein [Paracoccus sp. (in: a-proteobacteria)]